MSDRAPAVGAEHIVATHPPLPVAITTIGVIAIAMVGSSISSQLVLEKATPPPSSWPRSRGGFRGSTTAARTCRTAPGSIACGAALPSCHLTPAFYLSPGVARKQDPQHGRTPTLSA